MDVLGLDKIRARMPHILTLSLAETPSFLETRKSARIFELF